jgi:hypothetical protein
MKGLTSSLWPIHYKPLPDELLSCWLVRLAHGHGLKVQTFCNVIFGNHHQVWNRDIDRLAPLWLVSELSLRTNTPPPVAFDTTLRSYEGILYRKFRRAGSLHWVLVLQMYHRERKGHGLQFCPTCLSEDAIPYFRKCWRIALNTVCHVHGTMMLDRCPSCSAAIAVHRIDMREKNLDVAGLMYCCHLCGFDLRIAPTVTPIFYCTDAAALLLETSRALATGHETPDLDFYSVMHQLCRILTARYKHTHLRQFTLENLGAQDIQLSEGHISFEMRSIEERHHLMQLCAWLIADLEPRLTAAWRARSVRYSVLIKDFPDRPEWYSSIVVKFSNWRIGIT